MFNKITLYKTIFIYILYLLLLSIFIVDDNMYDRFSSSKRSWYYLIACIVTIFNVLCHILNKGKKIEFTILDILYFAFVVWILIAYDYQSNYAPHSLSITILSLPIYLYIKQGAILGRRMLDMIELLFATVLIYICYIGLKQILGFENSNNTYFRLTGPFFNPGPYGGFIAILQPMTLWNMLKYERLKPKNIFSAYSIIGKIYKIAFWISLIVLPLTKSRTAMFASIFGMGFVLIIRYKYNMKIFLTIHNSKYKKRIILIGFIMIILSSFTINMLYDMKKDSANGRLFIWKISLNAIKQAPITGTGLGGFAKTYSKIQHDYFSRYDQPENLPESRIAGSPEYGFNEYLQIAIEFGIPGLILYLSILLLSLISMIKKREVGLVGSILAFMIFSFASYPLRILSFHVILIPLLAMISIKAKMTNQYLSINKRADYIMTSMILLSFVVFYERRHEYNSYNEFKILKSFGVERVDDSLLRDYENLYKNLHYEPGFLLCYGILLASNNRYEESNKILKRGIDVSADPMFYNLIGKNYQVMGEYMKAEENYVYSYNLLPNRFYPLYLLVKMYSETNCSSKEKIIMISNNILNKEIKIPSPAITDMQREVELILSEYKDDNIWNVKD